MTTRIPFSVLQPRDLTFGRGCVDTAVAKTLALGQQIMLVRGRSAPWNDVFRDDLRQAGGHVTEVFCTREPHLSDVTDAVTTAREAGCDVLVEVHTADELARARTFRAFDDLVTARLHGFDDADDYYTQSSGMRFLATIERPLLVVHAADDPFMTEAVIPPEGSMSPSVTYELSPHGGHLGFLDGGRPWRPRFYLERRLLTFFDGSL